MSQTTNGTEAFKLMKPLLEYANRNTKKLIYFLYTKGYSQKEIGGILGVTRQAISIQYPKKGKI